jgi:iron complex outermembrane receptor protein
MERIMTHSIERFRSDQVLVLVKWKRRHTSSLVNVNGSPGRGAVPDLNAFLLCYRKIEVLRDGASAQYGSDTAGVINMKKDKKLR